MGVKGFMKKVGELPVVIEYEAELRAMRGQYDKWLFWQEHAQEMQNDPAVGEDKTRVPESYFGNHSLHAIQSYFLNHPETMILYGDEDAKGKDGRPVSPWFRPDWSPELLESRFYLGSLIAIRESFLREAMPGWKEFLGGSEIRGEETDQGKRVRKAAVILRNETPDALYRERIFFLCEKAGGWEKGRGTVAHLPGILWHCDSEEKLKAFADPATGHGREEPKCQALLSVVIPTKDHPELLEGCIAALRRAAVRRLPDGTGEPLPLEIIVVDNGSSAGNRARMEKLPGITYLYEPMDFNFSRMCNLGAAASKGELLLFLNDDVELLEESGLEKMEALAERPGVGSVGLKLYYPGGKVLQHAGITNLPTGPVHKLLFLEDEKEYYFGRNRGLNNVLAVSAACVCLRRTVFLEAGGFDESLAVAYNDVALGFKLYEMGYRNVVNCDAFAYHHESLTRGSDADEQKRERLMAEQERLYGLFPGLRGKDPYFSDYLSKRASDTMIRPAYETMNNARQGIFPKPVTVPEGIRMDPCLRFCVEEDRNGELLGHAVVLGDDNACYERFVVFEGNAGERFMAPLYPQYRPDLEEKMPDQVRVALCGFWIFVEKGTLAPGKYRVGCLAKRKVGNLKLFYWSDHHLNVSQ